MGAAAYNGCIIWNAGTCACSRLLQTRYQGLSSVSVEGKVMREALKPGPDNTEGYPRQVGPADFKLMHKAIQSMRLCEKAAEMQPYTAILFEWQVAPPSFRAAGS